MPDLLLRRADRKRVARLPSRHLPPGVLDDDEFSPEVDIVGLSCGDRLCMFTDGFTETTRADGEMFGIALVLAIVGGADSESSGESWTSRMPVTRMTDMGSNINVK